MASAPAGAPRPPVPVAVVAGPDPAARARLLRRWLRERAPDERWLRVGDPAVFGDDPAPIGAASTATAPTPAARPADADRVALAGCACCAALPALRAGLARALRAGRPDRILVDADARADLPALVDALRMPPFDALLDVDAVVVAVDPVREAPRPEAADPVRARLGCATVLVGPAGAAPDALQVLARRAGAPGWPASWLPATFAEDADGGVALDAVRPRAGRADADATDPAAERAGGGDLAVRWPASARFDRRALVALFAGWARDPAVRSAHGVFRTERAWYACQALDGVADCDESPRRRDSRCTVVADAAFDRVSALAALQAAVAVRDDDAP